MLGMVKTAGKYLETDVGVEVGESERAVAFSASSWSSFEFCLSFFNQYLIFTKTRSLPRCTDFFENQQQF